MEKPKLIYPILPEMVLELSIKFYNCGAVAFRIKLLLFLTKYLLSSVESQKFSYPDTSGSRMFISLKMAKI